MHRTQRAQLVRGVILPITVAIVLSACHKWSAVEPPDLFLQDQAEAPIDNRDVLRLRFEESDAIVEGKLRSLGRDSVIVANGSHQVTVPLSTISEVSVRRGDAAGTAGVVLGSLVGCVLLLGVVVAATCDPSSYIC